MDPQRRVARLPVPTEGSAVGKTIAPARQLRKFGPRVPLGTLWDCGICPL
jgi:hypothetical protein